MRSDGVIENVRFERPMVDQLRAAGLHAVDMHFHTNHSDAYTKIQSAVALAKRRGVGLAITDHNTPTGAVEAHRLRPEESSGGYSRLGSRRWRLVFPPMRGSGPAPG